MFTTYRVPPEGSHQPRMLSAWFESLKLSLGRGVKRAGSANKGSTAARAPQCC